jgi:hypothetical protein
MRRAKPGSRVGERIFSAVKEDSFPEECPAVIKNRFIGGAAWNRRGSSG